MKPRTLLLSLLCSAPLHAVDPFHLPNYKEGDNRKLLSSIEEEIRNASPEKRHELEIALREGLPSASPDGRVFIFRQLQLVASDDPRTYVYITAGLSDDDDRVFHAARIVLESMKGEKATKALLECLKSSGFARRKLGVIASLGERRDPAALPDLVKLLESDNDVYHLPAARAIAKIATLACVEPLSRRRDQKFVLPLLELAANLQENGHTKEARDIYISIPSTAPAPVRIAAHRGYILVSDKPLVALSEAFDSDNDAVRLAGTAALREVPRELRQKLVERIQSFPVPSQLLILQVLVESDRPTPEFLASQARPGIDPSVRVAAIEAMANFGSVKEVPMLVKLAASDANSPAAAAAKRTLQRLVNDLNGPQEVDQTLADLTRIRDGADIDRAKVALQALAARRGTIALRTLESLMHDDLLAGDALNALADVGEPRHLDEIMKILVSNKPDLRPPAEKAAAAIAARAPDKKAAATVVMNYLNRPAGHANVLSILAKIGGPEPLAAVRKSLDDAQATPEVKDAAIRSLANWPELAAAPELLKIARESTNTTHAVLALRGYLRLAGAAKDRPLAERVTMFKDGLAAAKRPDEKREALAGLAELPSLESLDLIRRSLPDAALTSEAFAASIKLSKRLALAYPTQSLATLDELKIYARTDEQRKQIDDAITSAKKAGLTDGFILSWLYAGPYAKDNKGATELMDVPFPPEQSEPADWKPFLFTEDAPRKLDFDKAIGGGNRCVYLKTTLTSGKAQEALLEMGSDDGIQVWLNGKVVHTNNVTRALAEGQDKVNVQLRQGPNTLLVKLTQGGGGWEIVTRLRTPDGKEIKDVTIAAQ